ncbi:XRE family transcriptional regulator [Roseateles albus]|uniref:XRE family transcriptional regulator n=1 Tax=Roseateles albus TaxID=2987525 RepID=A0ABT5KHY1_9BURK|nr:XRE family transcriptional regulator [Roseateles albus]MDC8773546.1 XRE family transcriptional regulator [Roseateles albus]
MVIREHSKVVLTGHLPDLGLEPGALGVVIHVHALGAAYEVEFMDKDGSTLGVETVLAQDLCEAGSANVYADLNYSDAAGMQRKASLAAEIAWTIKARHLSQETAAGLLGVDQEQVSKIARGQFRWVSESSLLELVAKLGDDLPFDNVQSEFVHRGLSAIARSEAAGDGIPAEQVIAKLEAKLAAAHERRRTRKSRSKL